LAERGQRIHTGQSDLLNQEFAENFTDHFEALAAKYPVYSELRNIFDLAMAVSLIQTNELAEQVGWQPGLLIDGERLRLPQSPVPRQVETVINHRVINRRHIVAGVSGGVMVAPRDVMKSTSPSNAGALKLVRATRGDAARVEPAEGAWWWDGALAEE
jgi:hypothetical protein